MKRIAVLGDSHLNEHSRFDECVRIHSWIAEKVRELNVDLSLHTGDVFHEASSPRERLEASAFFTRLAQQSPVVIVRGNHDASKDLAILSKLAVKHHIFVEEEASIITTAGVGIAAIAWPRKAQLLAASGVRSTGDGAELASEALRCMFSGLGVEIERLRALGVPTITAAHAQVRDSVTSTGQPLVGCDFEVSLGDLALIGSDAYALGHVHKGQGWKIGKSPVVYPGSPYRTAYGEMERKGFTLLEIDGGVVTETFIETPATPMLDIHATWNGTDLLGLEVSESLLGADVRLRYAVPRDCQDAADADVRKWLADVDPLVAAVKVEKTVLPELRSRCPEVALARTIEAKLEAYWHSKSFEPGERRESLIDKAKGLEAAHAA